MKNFLHIRDYHTEDNAQVMELHILALRATNAYLGPGPWDEDLERIEQVYQNGKGVFLVGEINGRIVSMGAFKFYDNTTAEIKRMRTHPDFQGKGYGSEVLKELEHRAKLLGYKKFVLDTSEKNVAAIHFYTKHGFIHTKTITDPRENAIGLEKMLFFEKYL